MSTLVFMDTETTGLSLDDDIWEFAAIRREEDGSETEHHLFIEHERAKCSQLPENFQRDHRLRYDPAGAVSKAEAAHIIEIVTGDRAHIVGAVPNFDTERLALLLKAHRFTPGWHYHLIDVEALAVGYLAGRAARLDAGMRMPDLPWNSDALSMACGVEPPTTERHTAMGDARWAMALYDAITGGVS